MIRKEVNYVDYNGNARTEECYFELSEMEFAELQYSRKGGWDNVLKQAIADNDEATLFECITQLILKAYGKKSEDGRLFIKSEEATKEFTQTRAYSKFMMEILKDATTGAEFINAVIPHVETTGNPAPNLIEVTSVSVV